MVKQKAKEAERGWLAGHTERRLSRAGVEGGGALVYSLVSQRL